MDAVLAIDVGGTKISVIAQDGNGTEIGRRCFPTNAKNYDAAMREIAQAGRLLVGGYQLIAVGVGVAGVVDKGILTGSGNLPGWEGCNIEADMQELFGVPVAVLNDAQAAGLGEYVTLGRSLIYVIWGTGVGVAIIINDDGYVLKLATELGHIVIDKKSRLMCGCGGRGHLEAHVGGANLPKRRLGGRRGRKAEHLASRQWNVVLRDMAVGLRSITAAAPGLPIVMGGGISNKQSHRLPALQKLVARLPSSCPAPEIRLAKHGEDSGLRGAAYAARQLVAA